MFYYFREETKGVKELETSSDSVAIGYLYQKYYASKPLVQIVQIMQGKFAFVLYD
jgi:hypothetical protein